MANIQWAPDYSTFIDAAKHPGAKWQNAVRAGEAVDVPASPGGFYTPRSSDAWGDYPAQLIEPFDRGSGFRGDEVGPMRDNRATYHDLKAAGLWDLSTPDSVTWKYLQHQAGGADVLKDPGALIKAISKSGAIGPVGKDRAKYESQLREAISSLPDKEFAEQFVSKAGERIQHYWDTMPDDSLTIGGVLGDMAGGFLGLAMETAPLWMTALGVHGLQGAGVLSGGTAAGAAGSASGAELAALIESGTIGPAGAAMETAGLSGGSVLFSTATGMLESFGFDFGAWLENPFATTSTAAPTELAAGGAMDMGVGTAEVAAGFGVGPQAAAPSLIASEMTGIHTDPNRFLLAEGPSSTMTDVSPGLLDQTAAAGVPGVEQLPMEFGADFGVPDLSGLSGSPGIIDSVLGWGKQNPLLASAALQVGGGVLAGIGNNATANEITDKRIAADKALLAQKAEEERALQEWKRQFTQSGSFFDANLPFKPAQNKQLRRPDGSLVYGPGGGLIAGQMTG